MAQQLCQKISRCGKKLTQHGGGGHLQAVQNVLAFFFVLLHTITWFNLAPRALVVRVRGQRMPDRPIVGANYGAWLVVSAVVAWRILRG